MPRCHACGAAFEARARIGFRDACERCDAELHACLNCRFYEPGASNDCREEQAERVVDKNRGNRCEWFQAGGPGSHEDRQEKGTETGAREKLEALFRKPGEAPRPAGEKKDPRAAAEDLFRKKR